MQTQAPPYMQYEVDAVLIHASECSLSNKMEYRITPSTNTKHVFGYIWESSTLYLDIDFARRMVVIPIYSFEGEPFKDGFYYLHVEVSNRDSNDCMIHPPISQCSQPIGQVATKTFSPVGRLYKHWNPPTSAWPGNNYSE